MLKKWQLKDIYLACLSCLSFWRRFVGSGYLFDIYAILASWFCRPLPMKSSLVSGVA